MDRNNHYNQTLKSEEKENHQLGDMKKCTIDDRPNNDTNISATYPCDGFSLMNNLTEILDHTKLSPGTSSSLSKVHHDSLASLLYDKRACEQGRCEGFDECREKFFSGSAEEFDSRDQGIEEGIRFSKLLNSDEEVLNLKLDSFSESAEYISSQIDQQRFSDYDNNGGSYQADLASEIPPELVPRGNKEGWARSRNIPLKIVNTGSSETIQEEQGAQEVIDAMKEYLDDMYGGNNQTISRSLGLEDSDNLNRTENHHQSGDTILPQDIIDYLEGPDYLDDLYGLPSLLEALKQLPSPSQMDKEQLKALRRLQSIQAHLGGFHS